MNGDECSVVEVDGEPVRVRGNRPMTDQDRTVLADVVRAARACMAADEANDPGRGETAGREDRGRTTARRTRRVVTTADHAYPPCPYCGHTWHGLPCGHALADFSSRHCDCRSSLRRPVRVVDRRSAAGS